jgi:hypothetical protein
MADPFTILGACASALQLFDEALRISVWACDFLRGWNDTANDIQRLQASQIPHSHVWDLITYISEHSVA